MIYAALILAILILAALYYNEINLRRKAEKDLVKMFVSSEEWSKKWEEREKEMESLAAELKEAQDIIKTIESGSDDDLKNW